MLATIAVSLLGLLLLGFANGSATGDVVHVLCMVSAIVLVLFRLRDEAKLQPSSATASPRAAEGGVPARRTGVRTGEISPA